MSERSDVSTSARFRIGLDRVLNSPLRRVQPNYTPGEKQLCVKTGLPSFDWCCPGFLRSENPGSITPSRNPFPTPSADRLPFPSAHPFPSPWPQPPFPGIEPSPKPWPNVVPIGPGPIGKPIASDCPFPQPELPRPPLQYGQIMGQIASDPKYAEAWSQLSDNERKALVSLLHGTQNNGELDSQFLQLVSSGKLLAEDGRGGTVLDHLHQIAQQELAPGVDRKEVLTQLAGLLNDPDSFNQDRQGTCTVTTIGRIQLQENPADFARMIAGLTSKEGSVELANGEKINRHQGSLSDNRSQRTILERLYQDALMEFGNGAETDYDVANDRHSSGGSGLGAKGIARVAGAVLGRGVPFTVLENGAKPGGLFHTVFEAELEKYQESGQEMLVGLNPWGSGGHMLSVTEIRDGYVYLSNPWGDGDQGGSNPPREAVPGEDGGRIRMKLEDFLARLMIFQPREMPDYQRQIYGSRHSRF
ncbi:MAG: hypothetical protein KC800_03800 [Candidatus Eremiobacteraeota bacterium]|nr:hypothetical protein [Candidatus Eremiobacteraeota bacterium]